MRFLTGSDYDHLCHKCQSAIDLCIEIVLEGPDTDNIEAPFDFAADHELLCGGSACKGEFEVGQICYWDGMYFSAVVKLMGFHPRGGFWLAEDGNGQEVCPDTDDLRVISDESPLGLRHAAHVTRMGEE